MKSNKLKKKLEKMTNEQLSEHIQTFIETVKVEVDERAKKLEGYCNEYSDLLGSHIVRGGGLS